ncbi:MAG: DNA-binding protein [Candidatus Marinimicrobia bacterium CG_4_9_14_3_um_filter_48_9]|nr:MAG: DNA-binding protein [Candidatus Marinimicrobia bacterium CG_4_9_14_3_um_filter_48_9]
MNDSIDKSAVTKPVAIQNLIYSIRGNQVMLDQDLANLYQVETRRLNEQVKRNKERFPSSFMFQLTRKEYDELLRSQNVISSEHGGRRYLPNAFTEQGVAMLSAVLKSETAVKISIRIMEAFVNMRRFLLSNSRVFERLDSLELKQLASEGKIEKILDAIESKKVSPKQAIFFDGQFFDAYQLVSDLIRSAKKSIILIDNYIDDRVLVQFTKRKVHLPVTIYTNPMNPVLKLDVNRFNVQYPQIELKTVKKFHDRYLIIDRKTVYHFGASLKDLGKKTFSFTKLDLEPRVILSRIEILDNSNTPTPND